MIIKSKQLNVKLSPEEYKELVKKSKELKFNSISEYARFVLLNAVVEVRTNEKINNK